MGPKIRVGPAGWDYKDWRGTVYPERRPKDFDELGFLANYFNVIEINSTFYRPAKTTVAETWAKRVAHNPTFRFAAKVWKRFTHDRGMAWTAEDVRAVREPLDVLEAAGRLGAVLLQFPWSFRREAPAEEWLRDVLAVFAQYPLVVEVRHASWNSAEVFSELAERGVGLVNVDQPLFANSIRPAAHATSSVGYARLHGRNYKQWFRRNAGRDARYDYFYSADELRPWADRIREIASSPLTREVYAVTNNHHLGKAPANAAMIESMLSGRTVRLPPDLYARYRDQLQPFATPDELGQVELFNR